MKCQIIIYNIIIRVIIFGTVHEQWTYYYNNYMVVAEFNACISMGNNIIHILLHCGLVSGYHCGWYHGSAKFAQAVGFSQHTLLSCIYVLDSSTLTLFHTLYLPLQTAPYQLVIQFRLWETPSFGSLVTTWYDCPVHSTRKTGHTQFHYCLFPSSVQRAEDP